MPVGKVDIIHYLAERYGYRRYLEIATSTTGGRYASIDSRRFDDCRRLMYRCAPEFSDGLPVDYRCPDLDISSALAAIAAEDRHFDVLIDPWHTYEASLRDISSAFELLDEGGTMVIHDCLPPSEQLASPVVIEGAWCGVTFRAFLDFVVGRSDLRYLTIDTDYGCGVIRKLRSSPDGRLQARMDRRERSQVAMWKDTSDDDAWQVFTQNHKALLRLTSVRSLYNVLQLDAPSRPSVRSGRSLAEARHFAADAAAWRAEAEHWRRLAEKADTQAEEARGAADAARVEAVRVGADAESWSAAARSELDTLRAERVSLLGSRSWRLTAPLRRLRATLR